MQTTVVVLLYNNETGEIDKRSAVIDCGRRSASEIDAQAYAERLASQHNPQAFTVALCRPISVVAQVPPERRPQIVTKIITENGEVLPKE